jgi:SulP family sulfate permease
MLKSIRSLFHKDTLGKDSVAGLVLGVESVPDGLAGGLLAGVNPIYGLYGYLFGMVGGALATSSVFMTVQATGAMAIVVADVGLSSYGEDEGKALFTLAILTGIVMLAAGLLKLGFILRFVSNAVMVGFISAVGINIILGQLDNFTGYEAEGGNRVARTFDLLFNPTSADLTTVLIGCLTIFLIVVLEKSPMGPLGMVVAVIVGSAIVPLLDLDVAQLRDITEIPSGLPAPTLPLLSAIPALLIPAVSLAFVGLVQGAGITAGFPNPDGEYPDASRDFMGQGVGNLVSGTFQGMPVGGSMSATSLVKTAGSRTRMAQFIAGGVMAIIILIFGDLVGYIAMPALAGLLMLVGFRTIKPDEILAVWKTGKLTAMVMVTTLVLTIIIPLQYAVLVGVAISMILYIVSQSNDLVVKQFVFEDGRRREVDPPAEVPANEVIVLQPYGSLFFASAAVFEVQLPHVTPDSRNAVVIVRLRGRNDLGSTLTEVLGRYGQALDDVDSRLVIITDSQKVLDQLAATGVTDIVGSDDIYTSDEWVGKTLRRAYADAEEWVTANQTPPSNTSDED